MTDPTPPLTEAEVHEINALIEAEYHCRVNAPFMTVAEVAAARASAVAAIRAAERERVLREVEAVAEEMHPASKEEPPEASYAGNVDDYAMEFVGRSEWYWSNRLRDIIATLRGEGDTRG